MTEASVGQGPFFFQRRFLPMWTGFSLGVYTDNMLKQALIIGLTFNGAITLPDTVIDILPLVSESADIVPYAGAIFALAMMLFSPIAGQFADKYETLGMFKRTKFVEFLLMVFAAIGFLTNNGMILVLALFGMGIQSAFFSPVRISAMPKYLAPGELVRGNAICSGGLFVANSLGYVFGGLLITKAGGPQTIAGILIIVALIGWLAIRKAPATTANAPDLKIDWNIFKQYVVFTKFVTDEPPVVRPLLGAAFFWFIVAAITIALPEYTKETLGADGDVSTGLLVAVSIGALVGATASAMLSKGRSGLQFSTASLLTAAIASVAVYLISENYNAIEGEALTTAGEFFASPTGWILAGLFMISSATMGMFIVPLQAAVQRRAKEAHRARIMASGNILNAAAALVGSLSVLAITGTSLQAHQAFVGIAVLQLVVVIYMFRRKRSVPEGLYDEMLAPSKVD